MKAARIAALQESTTTEFTYLWGEHRNCGQVQRLDIRDSEFPPPLFLFVLTIIALPICDTDIPSTFGASPLIFLFLKPLRCTDLLYPQQIADEAHVVIPKMTLIESLEIITRKISTFKTKLYPFLSQ